MSEIITDQFDPRFYQQPRHVRDAIRKQQDAERAPRTDAPTGSAYTPQQLYAKLKAEQAVKDRLAQSVASRVPSEPLSPFANRITDLEEQRAHCSPMDRPAVDRRLRTYRKAQKDWEAEQEAKAARAAYDQLPIVTNMREHAAAFERTPPPGSDESAVALAVATAKSNLFSGDGTDQAQRYWADIAAIEAAAEQRQREQLGQSVFSVKDALTGLETQKEALADTEARAEHARQMAAAGGTDAV